LWAEHYDLSWQTGPYTYLPYSGWTSGQPQDTAANRAALAMGFAIYEIAYDYNGNLSSLDLSSGTFRATGGNPPDAISMASEWLGGLVAPDQYTGSLPNLAAITSSNHQNLILDLPPQVLGPPVPEPLTVITSFLAVGALGVYLRKRTRVSAA
jgi:hypothetical protein